MPIMLVDSGSIFHITDECFQVGKVESKPLEMSKSMNDLNGKLKRGNKKQVNAQKEEDLYKIHMVFEKPTQYLMIPVDSFKTNLRSSPMDTNRGNNRYLSILIHTFFYILIILYNYRNKSTIKANEYIYSYKNY